MDYQTLFKITVCMISIYGLLIFYVRIVGLRSFSQIAAIDFAITVAIGNIITATFLPSKITLFQGAFALAVLFIIQWLTAFLRSRWRTVEKVSENAPMLLLKDGEFLNDNLRRANLSHADLMAKIREANATKLSQIKAVVFETNGQISVLFGSDSIDEEILSDVRT